MKLIILLLLLTNQDSLPKKNPALAMLLSTLPGGGQFYTEHYFKGGIFFLAQGILGGMTIYEHLQAEKAKKDMDWEAYEYHSDKRYTLLWWDFFTWSFVMGDAYVSAHFYKFKEQGKIEIGLRF